MMKFKIGCHAISEIMAGEIGLTEKQSVDLDKLATRKLDASMGKDKVKPLTANMEEELASLIHKKTNPELPAGAKTYVEKWLKRKIFNRKEEWKSIVIEKGLAVEPSCIALVAKVKNLPHLTKNEQFFDDHEYIYGIPDCIDMDLDEPVRDMKGSWDLFTFPMFKTKMPDDKYDWQLKGYMIITGKRKGVVDYSLIDTPLPLVQQDLKKLYFQSGGKAEDWNPDSYEDMMPNYRFDDIPEELRVKSFEVIFDPTAEEKIVQRVIMCRAYAEELMEQYFKIPA